MTNADHSMELPQCRAHDRHDRQSAVGQRKSTIETTLGCGKDAVGCRYPTMRGLVCIQTEWQLVCMPWNLKHLFSLDKTSLW